MYLIIIKTCSLAIDIVDNKLSFFHKSEYKRKITKKKVLYILLIKLDREITNSRYIIIFQYYIEYKIKYKKYNIDYNYI